MHLKTQGVHQREDLFRFVLAQKAIIHEDGYQTLSYGPVHQKGGDRGINSSGEGADHPLLRPNPLPNLPHGGLDKGFHGPGGGTPADAQDEICQDLLADFGMHHFRVKLHSKKGPLLVSHGRIGGVSAFCQGHKIRREFLHPVPMTHPHPVGAAKVQSVKEIRRTNELVGTNPANLAPYMKKLFDGEWKKGAIPELWDGKTAVRIVSCITNLQGFKTTDPNQQ